MSTRLFVVLAVAVAVGLATAVSPYASASPDGLENVATDNGFVEEGRLAAIQQDAPIPDYAFPGIENERVATGVAGFFGALGVMALGYGLALVLRRRSREGPPGGARAPGAAA